MIIPYQNIKNLVLKDEVIKAVEEGKFHIYPVKNVDEGIEILMGLPAGRKLEDGFLRRIPYMKKCTISFADML